MDILGNRNRLVGTTLAVAAALGVTACAEQQVPIYGDLGIIKVEDGQVGAVECVARNDDPDDQSIIVFNGPNVAFVKKNPTTQKMKFNDTVTLYNGKGDGKELTIQKVLDRFGSSDPDAYHAVTDDIVNNTPGQQVRQQCWEDLGDAGNLPNQFVNKFAFLIRRSPGGDMKISGLRGPIDGNNVVTSNNNLMLDNGNPLIQLDVLYR